MISAKNKFFLMHLATSLFLACLIVIVIFIFWYPSPLNKALGVTHIFFMMLAIDVIVGPLLGWFVYKAGKKSLKFDLSVIILVQIIALCYGVYSIAQARPVWIVYSVDRFEVIQENQIYKKNITKALPEFQSPSWLKPNYVGSEFSKDPKERTANLFDELSGIPVASRPERYVALQKNSTHIKKRAQDLTTLEDFNSKVAVTEILQQYPQATSWVPLKASAVDMVVLLDKDMQVIKIVDLRPWK